MHMAENVGALIKCSLGRIELTIIICTLHTAHLSEAKVDYLKMQSKRLSHQSAVG